MLVQSVMFQPFELIDVDSPISNVEQIAIELGVYHLPVSQNGIYIGVIDISCFSKIDLGKDISLSNYRSDFQQIQILQGAFVFDVLKIFKEGEYTAIPIVDDKKVVVGLLRLIDIVIYLNSTLSIANAGAFITLRLATNDYNLQEIARIVESNDARILSLHFEPETIDGFLLCTIKINKDDLSHILATFDRFEYYPIAHSSVSQNHDDLTERYNLLMKFLNI